jgi:ribosome-binding factor A
MNKKYTGSKKPNTKSQRQLQIGEQIKRILAEIFMQDSKLSLPGIYLTIAQADISPDAKNAKIFINIFGKCDEAKIIKELNQVAPYLRSRLANKINLRYTPELTFILDNTSKEFNKIENLLEEESKKFDG